MYTSICFLKIDPSQIVYLQALFEGYDGVGVVKTFDQDLGGICIISTIDMQAEIERIITALSSEISFESVSGPDEIRYLLDG